VPMRHWCARTPRPRVDHLAVRVRRQVGVPLRRGVVLVPEELLDVIQRNPVLHQPRGGGVAHDPGREPPDPRRGDRRVPDPVAEVLIGDRAAVGAVNTMASRGRPVISTDIPSSVCGGTGTTR